MADDNCLNSVDAVRASNLGACDDGKLTAVRTSGSQPSPPKSSRPPRVGGTQDDENALTALQGVDSGSARGAAVAGDDEIDRSDHCVRLPAAASLTTMGPVSVRKNASSCRSSAGFNRSGRRSLWPAAAAGARL